MYSIHIVFTFIYSFHWIDPIGSHQSQLKYAPEATNLLKLLQNFLVTTCILYERKVHILLITPIIRPYRRKKGENIHQTAQFYSIFSKISCRVSISWLRLMNEKYGPDIA